MANVPNNNILTTTASGGTIQKKSPSFIISDSSGGAKTAKLGADIPFGMEKTVVRNGANDVTITAVDETGGLLTISGQGSIVLTSDWDSATFAKDSTSGWILKSYTNLSGILGGEIVETITATQTAETKVASYYCDSTSGDIVLTLPTASTEIGKKWNIKKIVSANKITVIGSTGTIDGSASIDIFINQISRTVQFDGTNFKII